MEQHEQMDMLLSRLQSVGITYSVQETMARHTTFAIGGAAKYFLSPKNEDQLIRAICMARELEVPYVVLGRGSNVLFSDDGYQGMVLSTLGLKGISSAKEDTDRPQITAACGVSLRELALYAARHGWEGLAFAHGIPGTLGGAVRMNAGAFDGCIGALIDEVRCYCPATDRVEILRGEALNFSYRHSFLTDRPDLICLSATLSLVRSQEAMELVQERIYQTMEDMRQRRRTTQPLEFPSAGSVFKRPQGHYAGKLIEDCQLKGTSIGGAQVSEKHAGFIINRQGATARDVRDLIGLIQRKVQDTYHVFLEEEIVYISDDDGSE